MIVVSDCDRILLVLIVVAQFLFYYCSDHCAFRCLSGVYTDCGSLNDSVNWWWNESGNGGSGGCC